MTYHEFLFKSIVDRLRFRVYIFRLVYRFTNFPYREPIRENHPP